MNHRCRGAAFLLCFICSCTAAETISPRAYSDRLEALAGALESGQLEDAKSASSALLHVRIEAAAYSFESDATILQRVEKAKDLQAAKAQLPRIRTLLSALKNLNSSAGAAKTGAASTPSEHALLERLRAEEAVGAPEQAGEISGGELVGSTIFRAMRDAVISFARWVMKICEQIFDWVRSLFPDIHFDTGSAGISSLILKIAVIALAVAALVCVVLVLRKNDRRPRLANGGGSVLKASSKDADPTSRNADEWEKYAAQLAAAGQYREAIRACYHAVLATLFRSGQLNYRRGRTNWEYCYAVPPGQPWREKFLSLTRFFEIEWYGKHASESRDFLNYTAETRDLIAQARTQRPTASPPAPPAPQKGPGI